MNAVLAAVYVVGISLFLHLGPILFGEGEDSLLIPIMMLSLFVLSAAVMGYLFLGQPILRYLEGDRQGAVNGFLQTVGFFALFVFLAVLLALVF